MSISENLKIARWAVKTLRPQDAIQCLEELRADLDASAIGPDESALIEIELRQIRNLSEGVMTGISSARDLLRQLNELAQSCGTYDRDGRRLTHRVTLPAAQKF